MEIIPTTYAINIMASHNLTRLAYIHSLLPRIYPSSIPSVLFSLSFLADPTRLLGHFHCHLFLGFASTPLRSAAIKARGVYEADDIVGFTSHILTFPASTTSSIPLASQYADSSFFLLA